jgi:hypothetical protein
VGNMAHQREDHTLHWSKGDLVKVRSKTADNRRDAYMVIERERNLWLVVPEGMIHPDGTRHARSSLIAEEEPEDLSPVSIERTTKSDHHHESASTSASAGDSLRTFRAAVVNEEETGEGDGPDRQDPTPTCVTPYAVIAPLERSRVKSSASSCKSVK